MKTLIKPPHGAYVDSCYRHCGQVTDQLGGHGLGRLSSTAAFKIWFEGGVEALPDGGFLDQAQAFPCSDCCTALSRVDGLWLGLTARIDRKEYTRNSALHHGSSHRALVETPQSCHKK